MTSTPLIEVEDLTLSRGGYTLFESLSFVLGTGDIGWVQGPNGSGKSTLLRAICGFVRPDSGTISRTGDVAYLGHRNGLAPFARARKEIAFWTGAEATGFSRKQRISQLSEGQRKRVALDRMRAANAPIWLLDEPYAALDADARDSLDARLQAHCGAGGAALVVSHQGLRAIGRNALIIELAHA